jgi:uncharacterized protein YdgA (DUF945 family)
MKKITGISLTLILIAATYTAAAWYFGKHVEAMVGEHYSRLQANQPGFSIVKRDFQRGVFESEETVTLSISPTQLPVASGDKPARPIELTFHNRYKHGPIPGFTTLGAAIAETELIIPDEAKRKVADMFGGDKPPFTQHTEIHFDGSGSADFSSPAFDSEIPGKGDKAGHLAWRGLQGTIDFTPDAKSFNLHTQAPKLQLSDGQGFKLALNDIVFEGNWRQQFDDLTFMTGNSHFTIAELEASDSKEGHPSMTLKQLIYDIDLPKSEDSIDLIIRLGAQSLAIGNDSIGPAHLDFSFRHIQARALAEFYQKMISIYSDPGLQTSSPEELVGRLQAGLKPYVETILNNDPQFNIDRASFANPDGEARLRASVKLIGGSLEELANPIMLLAKLEANGDLSLPEEMIVKLLRNPPFIDQTDQNELTPEEIRTRGESAARQFQAQVAMLTEQGYLKREEGLIKTSITLASGRVMVNGKPFSPTALSPQQTP